MGVHPASGTRLISAPARLEDYAAVNDIDLVIMKATMIWSLPAAGWQSMTSKRRSAVF
jgi:hypothetical protein